MKKINKILIRDNGNVKNIYPVYLATGEILAIDCSDNETILKTFKDENELNRATEARYYNI